MTPNLKVIRNTSRLKLAVTVGIDDNPVCGLGSAIEGTL
jgi:hypothetical protein